MTVKQAREVARQWVIEETNQIPGFCGAFYHGSVNWLPDDAVLSVGSDVDVMVVLADPDPPNKLGKFVYREVLLEVSFLPADRFQSPEQVLGSYHLAGSFRLPGIIADPTGQLTRLQKVVGREYARRPWVLKRCEGARDNSLGYLRSLREAETFHDQVATWLFAAGVTTHVLLVAGLKNPTVRRRYLAARELLAEYNRLDFYEPLLDLLGCSQISQARVEHHLAALAEVFDTTKTVIKTPVPYAADITDRARPIAIDGSRDLIERGCHREAIFWIVATWCRCQKVLYHDAPAEMQDRSDAGLRQLLADLGKASSTDLQRGGEQVRLFLPRVWEMAETIMASNPGIED